MERVCFKKCFIPNKDAIGEATRRQTAWVGVDGIALRGLYWIGAVKSSARGHVMRLTRPRDSSHIAERASRGSVVAATKSLVPGESFPGLGADREKLWVRLESFAARHGERGIVAKLFLGGRTQRGMECGSCGTCRSS